MTKARDLADNTQNTKPKVVDAKGDLIAATAADTASRLAVGANNTVLTADSAEATGLKWTTPSSGGMTLLNAGGTAMSGASTSVSVTSTGYTTLEIFIKDAYANTNDSGGYLRINGDSGNNYGYNAIRFDGGPGVTGVQDDLTNGIYYIFNNLPSNNTTGLKGNSHITLFQPTVTTNFSVHWQSISGQNNGLQSSTVGGATYDASAAVTSIAIHCGGSSTWSGGTIYVYGVK
jgi:hypothetical protein